ncbi:LADA_0B05292g1_1 [Lachancea dasiensis]|uniref:DASH complex subunit DAM1 n=1 Tax=Lachancea dasiensis TaxID=1072105 RepID=A0A1G4ITB7_9SACH|nr:LADA_0B05292g1_1 [Lachancea dasiensis]
MQNGKNQPRSNTPVKDHRTATEYRLSISSNPGSRRSSLGTANNNDGSEPDGVVNTYLLPQIRELSDAMITLDSNFTQMNFIHESLVDLNESISALLYGLMCNSWCVDFPNMPHDTAAEIKLMQNLGALEEERKRLTALVEGQETNHEPKEAHKGSSAPTLKPPNASFGLRASPQRNWDTPVVADGGVDFNEDDNTDASFVSNPVADNLPPSAPLAIAERSRRMRRKSILHTMRSSVAGTHEITDPGKRRSLAVSASRIVKPPSRQAITGPARNAALHDHKKFPSPQWPRSKERPPFR